MGLVDETKQSLEIKGMQLTPFTAPSSRTLALNTAAWYDTLDGPRSKDGLALGLPENICTRADECLWSIY